MSLPFFFTGADSGDSTTGRNVRPVMSLLRSSAELSAPDGIAAERALLARMRDGDLSAFETLYHAHYASLLTLANRSLHSFAAAQDAVHDAFTGLWIRRADITIRTTVRAYLYWLVRNRALDVARRRSDGGRLVDERDDEHENRSRVSEIHDDADPVAALETSELEQRLTAALDALPERQRLALRLWWHDELSYAEIGDVLGISDVAARKLVGKGQAKLRPLLDL